MTYKDDAEEDIDVHDCYDVIMYAMRHEQRKMSMNIKSCDTFITVQDLITHLDDLQYPFSVTVCYSDGMSPSLFYRHLSPSRIAIEDSEDEINAEDMLSHLRNLVRKDDLKNYQLIMREGYDCSIQKIIGIVVDEDEAMRVLLATDV